jgi:hypothetical protein
LQTRAKPSFPNEDPPCRLIRATNQCGDRYSADVFLYC